jgi:hypothetical protein
MTLRFATLLILFIAFACTEEREQEGENLEQEARQDSLEAKTQAESNSAGVNSDTVKVETLFSSSGFDDKKYYELLIETHLCNPNYDPSKKDKTTPCSARFFQFYPYNHKREIENAFLLQVKAGVNNYPYRRLLIFVREKGDLVLMNGIVGYLVERISRPNDIDDLIVAVFDDLGNDKFDRYDVLIRYKEGKYHFVEAVGDLHGKFDTPELKERASKAILERINEKELIF